MSDEQTQQVEAIVRKHQKALQAIRRDVHPRVMAELDRVEIDVGSVLDDAQRPKWHALFTKLCEKWIPPLPEPPKENPKAR